MKNYGFSAVHIEINAIVDTFSSGLTSYDTTRIGISVCGMVDGSSTEFIGLIVCQIPAVSRVQYTVGKYRTGTNTEYFSRCACAFGIDVV